MINLNSASTQTVRALARLNVPGEDALLKLFGQLAAEAKSALVQADEMARIHRLQGRVQAFEELLRAVEDAKAIEAKR